MGWEIRARISVTFSGEAIGAARIVDVDHQSCHHKAPRTQLRCRGCGLPAQIGHLDEITNRPAGESQGLLRPDCPDTYASREPIPGRHLRRPGRDAGREATCRRRSRGSFGYRRRGWVRSPPPSALSGFDFPSTSGPRSSGRRGSPERCWTVSPTTSTSWR